MKRKLAYLATFEINHDDDTTTQKTVRVWSLMRGYNLMEILYPECPAFIVRIAIEYQPLAPTKGAQLKLF